jgi:hypothetical protein
MENEIKRKVTIVNGLCWKCDQPMKVAVAEDEVSSCCGPDEFTATELAFVRNKGVFIEAHDSKTAGETYLANTCTHCGSFAGNFYLFSQYVQPADIGNYTYEIFYVD